VRATRASGPGSPLEAPRSGRFVLRCEVNRFDLGITFVPAVPLLTRSYFPFNSDQRTG
jgi:hypothetical protein